MLLKRWPSSVSLIVAHILLCLVLLAGQGDVRASSLAGRPMEHRVDPAEQRTNPVNGMSPVRPEALKSSSASASVRFDPTAGEPEVPFGMRCLLAAGRSGLRLIQFPGPIQDDWYTAMEKAGLEVVTYIPDYAYLVWGDDTAVERLAAAAPSAGPASITHITPSTPPWPTPRPSPMKWT